MRALLIPPTAELVSALKRAEILLHFEAERDPRTNSKTREDYLEIVLLRTSLELAHHRQQKEISNANQARRIGDHARGASTLAGDARGKSGASPGVSIRHGDGPWPFLAPNNPADR